MGCEYINTNIYTKRQFGYKVYKLALSASSNCPNRDGKISSGGCIFCSEVGSSEFSAPNYMGISEQIEYAKKLIKNKMENGKYIAYFQGYTGTYGNLEYLRKCYIEACMHKDIVGISIATRADCLGAKEMQMLKEISDIKPLWVEIGLQTSNEETAREINRGYDNEVYEKAMYELKKINAHRITHVILGLPHESRRDVLNTIKYINDKSDGVKLHLMHIIRGTKLEVIYRNNILKPMDSAEYYELVADCLELLDDNIVVHRLTGDGAKKDLIAPLWSGDKKRVLNELNKKLRDRGIYLAKQ